MIVENSLTLMQNEQKFWTLFSSFWFSCVKGASINDARETFMLLSPFFLQKARVFVRELTQKFDDKSPIRRELEKSLNQLVYMFGSFFWERKILFR